MAIESIYLLDAQDNIILEHHWRGRPVKDIVLKFVDEKQKKEKEGLNMLPLVTISNYIVFNAARGQLTLLCPVSQEIEPLYVVDMLHRLFEIFEDYFGLNASTSMAIEANFDTIAQLFYEISDNGYPLTTEPNGLREIVLPPSLLNKLMNVAGLQGSNVTPSSISSIPWRRSKVKHTNNEIFVDVWEEISAIMDLTGRCVTSHIHGSINCLSNLSGIPDITCTVSPASAMNIPSFHPCVRISKFEQTPGSLSFIPPDGNFTLATYESELPINTSTLLPISVETRNSKNLDEFEVFLKTSSVGPGAENLTVDIALPAICRNASITSSKGEYVLEKTLDPAEPVLIKWSVGRLDNKSKEKQASLKCILNATGVRVLSHVTISYTIAGITASGIKIQGLRVSKVGDWKPFKGVKYNTKVRELVFRF